ncbi:TetR/AcrR family transcriptional regulator [Streptomyces sp. NPDC090088]|uniref:TetR/AcrR family transcriptional regulator n=1 Tax=Streptomyces sp. NPDC090088 TaxID=3365944 RepID=UPI00381681F4
MLQLQTQEQRSANTRRLVMRATIQSLVEVGYAGSSVQEIQARARVSRGAITHQFPTKHELLIAAIDHLSAAHEAQIRSIRIADSHDRAERALKALWKSFGSDLWKATLELWTASRTDDALRKPLLASERELGRRHRELFSDMLGSPELAGVQLHYAIDLIFRFMRGTALTDMLQRKSTPANRVVGECMAILQAVAGSAEGTNSMVYK